MCYFRAGGGAGLFAGQERAEGVQLVEGFEGREGIDVESGQGIAHLSQQRVIELEERHMIPFAVGADAVHSGFAGAFVPSVRPTAAASASRSRSTPSARFPTSPSPTAPPPSRCPISPAARGTSSKATTTI